MIIGKIHPGSGIGDQLFSYITTRTIALDKGYSFGFVGKEYFKGANFMNLDWGQDPNVTYTVEQPAGKLELVPLMGTGLKLWEAPQYYDPNVNFIEDGTVIDGCSAQDERYWDIEKVREWLKAEPIHWIDKSNGNNICILNIRGGEYRTVSDLFLPKIYWDLAIEKMIDKYPNMEFEIHTDDSDLAIQWFPQYPIIKDIALNWRSVRYAKHLVLSNSAFGILPALLNENAKEIIAPFGWNARNASQTKWLGRPMNYYKKFIYV